MRTKLRFLATMSGRKMSLTEPRRAPWRSASGVNGQMNPLAAKTAHSVSAIPRAPAVRRVGRPRSPSRSTIRIDVAITVNATVWMPLIVASAKR